MDYNLSENYLFYLVDSIFIHGIVIILRGTLTSEDVHWNIKLGAVHLAFPRDAGGHPDNGLSMETHDPARGSRQQRD